MPRDKSENLRSVFALLFLNIAFFFLEHQDAEKYASLFQFEAEAVMNGELWRVLTYQFTQAGQWSFPFPKPVVLFFTLLLLYWFGSAIEEEWGTARFLALFVLSAGASAGAAAWMGIPLLGSYFVYYSLLFVYAGMFPRQTLLLLAIVPVRITWIAWLAAVMLAAGMFAGGASNAAALAGAVVAYVWYLMQRRPVVAPVPQRKERSAADEDAPIDTGVIRNAARVVAMKKAIATQSAAAVDRLSSQFAREVVAGVNICPPVDFKPDHNDGYCIRCEGFAECSVRFLAANRPRAAERPAASVVPEAAP